MGGRSEGSVGYRLRIRLLWFCWLLLRGRSRRPGWGLWVFHRGGLDLLLCGGQLASPSDRRPSGGGQHAFYLRFLWDGTLYG